LDQHTGLPQWLSIDERKYLRLAIVNALHKKPITWNEPVQTFAQMKLTLVDKQYPVDSAQRLAKVVVLRAMPKFHGKPAFDTVKLKVEEENGRIRTYFGKCLAFFKASLPLSQTGGKHATSENAWRFLKTPARKFSSLFDGMKRMMQMPTL
jgi:hypothetical protein